MNWFSVCDLAIAFDTSALTYWGIYIAQSYGLKFSVRSFSLTQTWNVYIWLVRTEARIVEPTQSKQIKKMHEI